MSDVITDAIAALEEKIDGLKAEVEMRAGETLLMQQARDKADREVQHLREQRDHLQRRGTELVLDARKAARDRDLAQMQTAFDKPRVRELEDWLKCIADIDMVPLTHEITAQAIIIAARSLLPKRTRGRVAPCRPAASCCRKRDRMRALKQDDPFGTPVRVREDRGNFTVTKTRSGPWQLGQGGWVVLLEGRTGGFLIERCSVIEKERAMSDDRYEDVEKLLEQAEHDWQHGRGDEAIGGLLKSVSILNAERQRLERRLSVFLGEADSG